MTVLFQGFKQAVDIGLVAVFGGKWFFDPDILIIFGLCLLFAGAVFAWAAFFRKRRPPPDYRHRRSSGSHAQRSANKKAWSRLLRRKRRRRRRELGRNPTLAETTGLPPVRSDPPETQA